MVTLGRNVIWLILRTRAFEKIRLKITHTPAFLCEGKIKGIGESLSAVVFASQEAFQGFSEQIFAEKPKVTFLGRKTFKEISDVVGETHSDIAFADVPLPYCKFLISNRFFILPYIDFTLSISESMDEIYARMKRDHRRVVEKVADDNYTYEISHDSKKLTFFYDKLYVAHTLRSHGKSARLVSFAECQRFFRKGGLLFVKLEDNYVSGVVYVESDAEIYVPVFGINDEYLKRGAGYASVYFMILWAKQKGFTKIDYGTCLPFFTNGVFFYKKNWGMAMRRPKEKYPRIQAIRFNNFGNGAKSFLAKNPFIFAEDEKLKGLVLSSSCTEHRRNSFQVPGLSNIVVLCPSKFHFNTSSGQVQKLSSDKLGGKISLSLSHFMKLSSEKGFDLYQLDCCSRKSVSG